MPMPIFIKCAYFELDYQLGCAIDIDISRSLYNQALKKMIFYESQHLPFAVKCTDFDA
jgi:hypothetical protein